MKTDPRAWADYLAASQAVWEEENRRLDELESAAERYLEARASGLEHKRAAADAAVEAALREHRRAERRRRRLERRHP